MKRLIMAAIVLTAFAQGATAQAKGSSYKTALGVKFYPGAGITLKHFVKSNAALEGIGYFWRDGMRLTGFCSSRPQPSPVLPSAEMPPRCCMRAKADIARRTSLWLASPSMWANRPKPQLSLSSFGSYSDIAFLPCSAFHRTVINRLHKLRLALVVPSA